MTAASGERCWGGVIAGTTVSPSTFTSRTARAPEKEPTSTTQTRSALTLGRKYAESPNADPMISRRTRARMRCGTSPMSSVGRSRRRTRWWATSTSHSSPLPARYR